MEIRKLENSDLKEVLRIHDKFYNFAFPDLNNPLYALQRVVIEKNKIVLAAIVKLTSEGIFITDKDVSPLTRMKAIKIANQQLYKDVVNFGIDDCHTFAEEDSGYINILRKLGWVDCTGFPLVRQKDV